MNALSKSLLLFVLNWLDAQLTIIWIRAGLATEGNSLMARLLEMGNAPFLLTKLAVGALVAYTLYRWAHLPVARRGMQLVLGLYLTLMLVHAATGASALGWHAPEALAVIVSHLPANLLALFA